MAKEWFTVDELRGADVPGIDSRLIRRLSRDFQSMSKDRARVKRHVEARFYEVEFHIWVIPEAFRASLQAFYGAGSVYERIARLGICRPVADQRSRYVARADEKAITELDELLQRRRKTAA